MEENSKKRSRKSKLVPRDCLDSDDENIASMQEEIEAALVQIKNKNILKKLSKPPVPKPPQLTVKIEVEELSETPEPENNLNIRIDSVKSLSEPTVQPPAVPSTSTDPNHISDETLRIEIETLSREITSLADRRIDIHVKNFLGNNRKVEPYNYVDDKLQAILRRRWTAWRNTFPHIRESPMLYKCDKCNKAWWHFYEFREHLLKRHKKKMTIQLQTFCHECHIIAYSGIGPELREEKPHIESNCWRCRQDLAAHVVSKCDNGAKYRCKGCMEKFYTCTLLYDHRPVCPLYVSLTKTVKQNYPCSQCPAKYSTETQLLTHMVMRHSVRSDLPVDWVLRICTNCNYAFHLQSLHDCPSKPPVASCKFCLQKYNTHPLLMIHINESINEERFPCKVCGVKLNKQCMELQHLMEHTVNYTTIYKCIYCTDPMYFPTLYLVNKHKFTMHRAEKESKNLLTCYDMVVVPKRLAARLPGFEQAEKQRQLEPISLTEKSFDSSMDGLCNQGESSSRVMVQNACTGNLAKKAKYDMKSSSISNVDPKKHVTKIEKPNSSGEEVVIDITLPESSQDEDFDVEILDNLEENVVIDITELDHEDEVTMRTEKPGHQQNKNLAHIKTPQEKINNIPESDLETLSDVKVPLYNQENNSDVQLHNNTANIGDETNEEECNDDTIDLTQENNIDDIDMADNTQERDRFDINMPEKLKGNPKKMTTDNINDVPPTVINQFDPCVVIKKEMIDYSETTDHTEQEPEEMPAIKIESVRQVKEEPLDIIQEQVNILNSNSDTNNTSVNVVNSNNDTNNTTDNKALIKHIVNDNLETRHVIIKLVEKVNVLNNNSDTNNTSNITSNTHNTSNIKTIVKQTVNDNLGTGRVNKKLRENVNVKKKRVLIKRRYAKLAAKQTVKGNLVSHFVNDKKLIHIHKITKTYTNNKLKRAIDIMEAKIDSIKLRTDINKKLRANIDNETLKNNINFIKLEPNIGSDKLITNNENVQANDVENNSNNDKLKANIDTFSDAAENDKLIDNIEKLKSDVENDKVKANIDTLNNAVANDILQTDYDKLKANIDILRNDGNDQPKTDCDKLQDNLEKLRNDVENDKLKTNNDKLRVTIDEFINDKLTDDSNVNTDTNMSELVNVIKQEVADTVVYDHFEVGEEVINFKIKEENLEEFMEDDMIILNPNNSVSIKYEIDPVATTSSEDVEMQSLEPEVIVYQSYGKKLYKCTKCDYMGFHQEYKIHLQQERHFATKKKHPCLNRNKSEHGPGYLCTKCDLTYQSLYKYNIHFCKVHDYKPLTCPKCFRRVVSAQAFHSHIHSHIKDNFVNIYVIKTKGQDDARNTHQCKVCAAKVVATDFFTHWESHLEILDVPRKSQIKNKGFSPSMEHKHELKKMLLLLQGLHPPGSPEEMQFTKLRNCVKCNRRFERKNECKRHFIEHLLSDAYAERHKYGYLRCQICSQDFYSSERYKRHMREHGSLPIYKCELCDKAFSDSSNFTKHKKVHNLHVLICDICNKKFTGKAFLEKHIIMHQKVKPLVCNECNKVFYTESSYRKHISRGKTRFKCPSCHVFFTTLRDKWDHMWEEHKERKVQADCPICKKAFRKHQDVRNHIRVEHQDTHYRYVPNKTVLSDQRQIAPKPQPKANIGADDEVVVVYMDQSSKVLYSSKAGHLAQNT